jgi:hypothetical protein
MHDVSLSILAGPPDSSFAAEMVSHIVRANHFSFARRTLVIDLLPNPARSDPARVGELIQVAQTLRERGVVDSVSELGASHKARGAWARKHFGKSLRWDRDYRGCPLFGWIAGIESSDSEYHVHFDCDVLLHQALNYSWIERGIDLLSVDPSVMCVMPHPGPPRSDGVLYQPNIFSEDARGFYRFPSFSSRRFLISRRKYESLLPMPTTYASRRHYLKSLFSRVSPVQNWEHHVNVAIHRFGVSRAALKDSRAWTLHAPDHGREFQTRIGSIIAEVEHGRFPASQAGHYDLRLEDWRASCGGDAAITSAVGQSLDKLQARGSQLQLQETDECR